MFAVSGWKVTGLKAQIVSTEPKPSKASKASKGATTDSKATPAPSDSTSKKRKRGSAGGAQRERQGRDENAEDASGKLDSNKKDGEERKKARKDETADKPAPPKASQPIIQAKDKAQQAQREKVRDNGDHRNAQIQGEEQDTPEESAASKRRKRKKKARELAKANGVEELQVASEAEDKSGKDTEEPVAIPSLEVKRKPKAKEAATTSTAAKLTPLQAAMRQKLIGSRFRYLNETLYTTPSESSAELFKNNPAFFDEYHEGFARQVESWPENPVDGFVKLVLARASIPEKGYVPGKTKGADKLKLAAATEAKSSVMGGQDPLPRDFKSRLSTIADLGCGAGSFAQELHSFSVPLHLKVHSFDLAAPNEHVTVADIRSLPLADSSVDVTVFSLALMGTNWIDFIEEAWRILRWKGECWVADVNSRFAGIPAARGRVEHSVGARVKGKKPKGPKIPEVTNPEDEGLDAPVTIDQEGALMPLGKTTDVSAFIDVLRRRGFALLGEPDLSNRMFARMRFVKALPPTRGKNKPREKERFRGGRAPEKYNLKFVEKAGEEDHITVDDERRVLKPCVYKTR